MDYAELATLAQELIDDAGRDVTIVRFKQSANDSAKPWQGPGSPTTVPNATATVKAVMAAQGLGFKGMDQDLMKKAEQFCLVGPTAGFDLATANAVIDGSTHWRVLFIEMLKPADTVLLYIMGLGR